MSYLVRRKCFTALRCARHTTGRTNFADWSPHIRAGLSFHLAREDDVLAVRVGRACESGEDSHVSEAPTGRTRHFCRLSDRLLAFLRALPHNTESTGRIHIRTHIS